MIRGRACADRRIGIVIAVAAIAAVAAAQAVTPLPAPPLYDGVVPAPYVWLDPPPGERGGPQSATVTDPPNADGTNPLITLSTPELPAQAQFFALSGVLSAPAGTTSIVATITAVEPLAMPVTGHIDGNVYRLSVDNQAGVPLTFVAGATPITVALRGTAQVPVTGLWQYSSEGGWQDTNAKDAGFPSTLLANVTSLGDFALMAAGPPGVVPVSTGVPILPLALLVMVIVAGGAVAGFAYRRARRMAQRPAPTVAPRSPAPQDRRRPKPRGGSR